MKSAYKNPWSRLGHGVVVTPSLLACDFMRLGEQISAVESAGATVLHVDVMDGHFVPNLALNPGLVHSVRAGSDCLLDVHLMVTNPLFFAEPFVKAGADSITFHIEANSDPYAVIDLLRAAGVGVGIVLKPGTVVAAIAPVVELVDLVLIMTVEPGFGGQSFIADQLDKICAVREMAGQAARVEVDGGINQATAVQCVRAGADTLVAGVDIFGAEDIAAAFADLQAAAAGVAVE
ncbi:MAG: ribulose-phosphate 3-epimerase [Planctomycetes bacterium]|nr:ribulose-phosphate 3-epimerase [Planctomycetota bacterium]